MEQIKRRFPNRSVPADNKEDRFFKHDSADAESNKKGKLTGQTKLLLLIQGLFTAANALSGTFVNVYLWKVKNDFSLIGWFALSHQLVMSVTFWLAGKWVKEHNKMHSLRIGVAVSAVFYMLVLFLGKTAVSYVVLLGAVQGISSGLFWLAFNVVYFEVTNPNNRDKFNGWAGLLGAGAGMLAPWISGFLITRMNDTSGYRLIFTISLVIFVIGVIASWFLKKRKVQQHYEWFYSYYQLKKERSPWRVIVPALVAQGVREGVFGFIIGLLVYIVTKQELKLGNFSLITSAVAFVSFWLAGKLIKPNYRNVSMLIGSTAIIAVIVPFFWKVSYFTLLVFGIGVSLFIPLYVIPMTSSVFDMIGTNEDSAKHRVEYVVLRELALNAGRMLGTILFIIVVSWSTDPLVLNIMLLVIGSSPLAASYFMRKLPHDHWKEKAARTGAES